MRLGLAGLSTGPGEGRRWEQLAEQVGSERERVATGLANISFHIWTGATIVDMEGFGLSTALPAAPIIDQAGRIAFRMVGDV